MGVLRPQVNSAYLRINCVVLTIDLVLCMVLILPLGGIDDL